MKIITTYILFFLSPFAALSQTDTIHNSFESLYNKTNPTLKYKYDPANQIHDYSDNWDFDMDGKNDQLLFIGTGGAHLYFYLRIVLSADSIERNYPFIDLDMPILPASDKLKKTGYDPVNEFTPLAVFDADGDGINDIFLHIDDQTAAANSKQLKKHGIKSTDILITFKNKKIKFNNY